MLKANDKGGKISTTKNRRTKRIKKSIDGVDLYVIAPEQSSAVNVRTLVELRNSQWYADN